MSYTDYSVELGAGKTFPSSTSTAGRAAGQTVDFMPTRGTPVQVQVVVKQVRKRSCPRSPTNGRRSSEFSTVDELRQDIETRMSEMKKMQTAMSCATGRSTRSSPWWTRIPDRTGRRRGAAQRRGAGPAARCPGRTPGEVLGGDRPYLEELIASSAPGHTQRQGRPGPAGGGR